MHLIFLQPGMLGSELPPGMSPKKHFHCYHFKEQESTGSEGWVLLRGALSPLGSLGFPTFGTQPWQNSCRNFLIFVPFLWFLPQGKTDRRRKEMWECVCMLVLKSWKKGLWEHFQGYGNMMNEASCRKQLLQSSQWTGWLVPLLLQFAFFKCCYI